MRLRLILLAVALVVIAAASPAGRWRLKALTLKLQGNAPEWTWKDVVIGMAPGSWRSTFISRPFHGPVTFIKRDNSSPCPVLWDTPRGPMWAWFLDQPYLSWHIPRWKMLQEKYPDARPIPDGGVVLEVGAWVGTFVLAALDQGASHVIALEPEPSNYVCAQKNLAEAIRAGRVTLIQAAAWHENGEARFGHPEMDENGSPQSGGEGFTAMADGDSIVRTVTIDGLVEELGLERLDVIQMDIEGTERHALRGARRTMEALAPGLIVCIHHLEDDRTVIPLLVLDANPRYRQGGDDDHAFFYAE